MFLWCSRCWHDPWMAFIYTPGMSGWKVDPFQKSVFPFHPNKMGFRFPARKLSELVTFFFIVVVAEWLNIYDHHLSRTSVTLRMTENCYNNDGHFYYRFKKPSIHLFFLCCLHSESQRARRLKAQNKLVTGRNPEQNPFICWSFDELFPWVCRSSKAGIYHWTIKRLFRPKAIKG